MIQVVLGIRRYEHSELLITPLPTKVWPFKFPVVCRISIVDKRKPRQNLLDNAEALELVCFGF